MNTIQFDFILNHRWSFNEFANTNTKSGHPTQPTNTFAINYQMDFGLEAICTIPYNTKGCSFSVATPWQPAHYLPEKELFMSHTCILYTHIWASYVLSYGQKV